jgi:DNA-binding MarR family transcriptional regulator
MSAANVVSFRVQALAALLYKTSDRVLQEQLGIGMSQFKILGTVQNNQRLLQRHIATILNQTEASISRQIKLLHQRQLLVTQVNPKDHREHITVLTPNGRQVINAATEVLEAFQGQFMSGLSDKQQVELINLLDQIEQRLQLIIS